MPPLRYHGRHEPQARHPHAVPLDDALRRQPPGGGARRSSHGARPSRHRHRPERRQGARWARRSGACRPCSRASARPSSCPDEPYPRFFFAGATYAVRESRSLKLIAAPADLIANIDVLLEAEDFDLLHLNEPFVPGLGWTALRHASCPLVATFHANPERTAPVLASPAAGCAACSTRSTPPSPRRARRATPPRRRSPAPTASSRRASTSSGSGPAPTGAAGPLRLLFAGVESRRKGLGVLLRALRYSRRSRCGAQSRRLRRRPPGTAVRAPRPARLRGPRAFPGPGPGRDDAGALPERRRALRAVARPRDRGRHAARGHGVRGRGRSPRGSPATTRWCRTASTACSCRRASRAPWRPPCDACSTTPPCAGGWRARRSAACAATTGNVSPARSKACTRRSRPGGGSRCRAAAASSASSSPTSTCTRITARTA